MWVVLIWITVRVVRRLCWLVVDDMWVVLIAASITETHAPDASLRGEDGTELRIKAGEISKEREMRFVKDFSVVSDTKTTRDSLKNGEWTKHFV